MILDHFIVGVYSQIVCLTSVYMWLEVVVRMDGLESGKYTCSKSAVQSVFSLAYLRHVGPTNLQYRFLFDVGNGYNPKALLWLQTPPTPCPPIMPWILLGENTDSKCVRQCTLCVLLWSLWKRSKGMRACVVLVAACDKVHKTIERDTLTPTHSLTHTHAHTHSLTHRVHYSIPALTFGRWSGSRIALPSSCSTSALRGEW